MDGEKKVLIIEHDKAAVDLYLRALQEKGINVHIENNIIDGYYRIYRMHPDAVLLNIHLPPSGMDCPTLIGKLRAQKQFVHLPLIVLSDSGMSEEEEKNAMQAGATRVYNRTIASPQKIIEDIFYRIEKLAVIPKNATPWNEAISKDSSSPSSDLEFTAEASFSQGSAIKSEKDATESSLSGSLLLPDFSKPCAQPAANLLNNSQEEPISHVKPARNLGQNFEEKVSVMRQVLRSFPIEAGLPQKAKSFFELSQIAHTVSANACIAGLNHAANIASMLGALTYDIFTDPSRFAKAVLQTIAKSIDVLAQLLVCDSLSRARMSGNFNVLVVDDHQIARKMIGKALVKGNINSVATGKPEMALELLKENAFHLAILDIKMEKISGFDLCSEIRKMEHQQHCHVLFVTCMEDFQSRAEALKAGGNDYIVKPFISTELALKAMLHLVTSQFKREQPMIPEALARDPA